MPATKTLYPYDVSSELHLRAYDPYDPTDEDREFGWLERGEDESGIQKLDLTGHDEWRGLRIQLDANLPRAEMTEILPEASDWRDETSLVVSVRCASTKFRRAVELVPQDPFTWDGGLTLKRSEVRSVVELHPMLVRKTRIPGGQNGRPESASRRGAVLATGPSLRLYVDETERPVRGALDVRWEDFSEPDNPWSKEDLFAFDAGGDEPTLWLNSWYQAFKATLDGSERSGVDTALRHVLNALAAQTTWMQLFMTAAGQLAAAEEPVEESLKGWERDVLSNFLPRIFPDEQTDEDRREQLAEIMRSPDQMGTLMAQLGHAAQEVVGTADHFQKAIRVIEKEAGE